MTCTTAGARFLFAGAVAPPAPGNAPEGGPQQGNSLIICAAEERLISDIEARDPKADLKAVAGDTENGARKACEEAVFASDGALVLTRVDKIGEADHKFFESGKLSVDFRCI